MSKEYPNLPLVEERFKNLITDRLLELRTNVVAEKPDKSMYFAPDFVAEVFLQTFPNTAGLFQRRGTFSGQAFTDYYVTVIHETNTDTYGIFQGNEPVYRVTEPTDMFFEDFRKHQMATIEESKKRY